VKTSIDGIGAVHDFLWAGISGLKSAPVSASTIWVFVPVDILAHDAH